MFITYPLYTALVIGFTRERFVALGLSCERTCELDTGAFLHCKASKDLLRGFGLWYCESWGIGENVKVKPDSTTQRCFL